MGSPILRGYSEGLRPEPRLTVSEWADKHRKLPQKSSAEPGPWRTSRTPYLREVMDNMSAQSQIEETILMWAAQLGKSEAILNTLGYVIDHAPGPAMLVQPTVDLAKRFSTQRVNPMLQSTPQLVGKVAEVKSRESQNSMLAKEFMGGIVILTGANSAVGLRSMPSRYLFLDEIAGYPSDVDGEGDPVGLAEARQRTFARRKRLKTSTPTIAGRCPIERAYEASDKRRYFVPCPHCGEMQTLEFPRLTWTKLGLPPEKAIYLCVHCEGQIEERHKAEMLGKGEWRPTAADGTDPKVRGYHLSALYCPIGWLSWGQIAKQFIRAAKDPAKLRVFTNTVLGEPYIEKGDAPEWRRHYERSRSEGCAVGAVARGGLFLTAGVDVQKDRLVYEIVAWGRGKESWSVDYGVLPGDTADLSPKGPWMEVDKLLARSFPHDAGTLLTIRMLAVDSGYNTMSVYAWARRYPMTRVIAIKGQPSGGALLGAPAPVEINLHGQRPIRGYKVWPVVGSVAKSELYGYLNLEAPLDGQPFPTGWCHFPPYGEDYFRQLTAEQLVPHRNRKGFTTVEWQLIPGRENHALDARVYARAAASLFGLDRFQENDWLALERAVAPRDAQAPRPAPRRAADESGGIDVPDDWLEGRRR
jgi:phage terminase large subunit GpA-like protein